MKLHVTGMHSQILHMEDGYVCPLCEEHTGEKLASLKEIDDTGEKFATLKEIEVSPFYEESHRS